MTVSNRFLIGIYAVLPVSLFLVALDLGLFHQALFSILPSNPQSLAIFNVFFVLPHIVASSLIFLDRDYLSFYRLSLVLGLGAAGLIAFVLPHVISLSLVLLINGVFTIVHVLAQQFGLTAAVSRFNGAPLKIWKFFGLAAGMAAYYLFYFSEKMPPSEFQALLRVSAVLVTAFLFATIVCHRRISIGQGKIYLWCNFALVLSAFICIFSKYYFFAVLIPRVVHDLTAFSFYVVHDVNRNKERPRNAIFRVLARIPWSKNLPLVCVTPIAGIVLGYTIGMLKVAALINFVTLFHYWTESYSWKSGGLHRREIRFSG